jgi:hypothetical protein
VLRVLKTTENQMETTLVVGRLEEAGVRCMRRSTNFRNAAAGTDVLVEEEDLDRAREILKADEGGFDERELERLSEEAGEKATE